MEDIFALFRSFFRLDLVRALERGDHEILERLAAAVGWEGFEVRRYRGAVLVRVPARIIEVGDRVWMKSNGRRLGRYSVVRSVTRRRESISVVTSLGAHARPPDEPTWRRLLLTQYVSPALRLVPALRVIAGSADSTPLRQGHLRVVSEHIT